MEQNRLCNSGFNRCALHNPALKYINIQHKEHNNSATIYKTRLTCKIHPTLDKYLCNSFNLQPNHSLTSVYSGVLPADNLHFLNNWHEPVRQTKDLA